MNGSIKAAFHSNIKHTHSDSFNVAPRGVLVLFRGCVEVFFPENNPALGTGPYCWYHCGKGLQTTFCLQQKSTSWRNPSEKPLPAPEGFSWRTGSWAIITTNLQMLSASRSVMPRVLQNLLLDCSLLKTFNLVKNRGCRYFTHALGFKEKKAPEIKNQ